MSQLLKTEMYQTGPLNAMPWVDGSTRIFGVIAHPADHVRAPLVFTAGLPHVMVPIDAPPLEELLLDCAPCKFWRFGGNNSHKMALADLCDTLTPRLSLPCGQCRAL